MGGLVAFVVVLAGVLVVVLASGSDDKQPGVAAAASDSSTVSSSASNPLATAASSSNGVPTPTSTSKTSGTPSSTPGTSRPSSTSTTVSPAAPRVQSLTANPNPFPCVANAAPGFLMNLRIETVNGATNYSLSVDGRFLGSNVVPPNYPTFDQQLAFPCFSGTSLFPSHTYTVTVSNGFGQTSKSITVPSTRPSAAAN